MTHPFAKLFTAALRKSTPMDNVVLTEAEQLKAKGYSVTEIYEVLLKLQRGLIEDADSEIVAEAVEEFGRHLP